nr:helix-turn-helix domain-containing protein [uncultured Flavobacterium sp.]
MSTPKKVHENVPEFKKMYQEILSKVIEARNASGLTKNQLAEILGVDRRKVYSMEAGDVSVSLLLRSADLFSIEVKLSYEAF